jgi:hypothetical protein
VLGRQEPVAPTDKLDCLPLRCNVETTTVRKNRAFRKPQGNAPDRPTADLQDRSIERADALRAVVRRRLAERVKSTLSGPSRSVQRTGGKRE